MLDNALLLTILFIIVSTVVGTFLNSRRRDRCLTSFRDFTVTLLEKGGKRVWGHLAIETSGLELLYWEDYQDQDHIETSYILFKEEYDGIYLLLRFHSELSEENKRKRIQEIKRAYHPSPLRLLARKARNVANTCKDSIFEVLGLAMTRATTANPALAPLASQQKSVKRVEKGVAGYLGRAYDPILEKHIGKRVVLEITTNEEEVQEYAGIFKDYSRQFLQVMDVSYLDGDQTRLCDIIAPRAHATIRHGAETLNAE
ncbi:hypothetical protein ES703_30895 [subsurface metagenome]